MTNLIMYDTVEDLLELTGLPDCDSLWDNHFDLDDWDVGFQSEKEIPEGWLLNQMDCYCVGLRVVQYGGKYYYMVQHA